MDASSEYFVSGDAYLELVKKYDTLRQKHERLQKDYGDVLAQLSKARVKVQEARTRINEWQRYYDTHPKYSGTRRGTHQSRSTSIEDPAKAGDATPKARQAGDAKTVPALRRHVESFDLPTGPPQEQIVTPVPEFPLITDHESSTSRPRPRSSPPSHRNTSSQTTEGEVSSDPVRVSTTDEDEAPVVVSERTLKRKRQSPFTRTRNADYGRQEGTPERPFQIKEENHSSPVQSFYGRQGLLRTETSDLDAIQKDREAQRNDGQFENMLGQYQQTGSWRIGADGRPVISQHGRTESCADLLPNENTPPMNEDSMLLNAEVEQSLSAVQSRSGAKVKSEPGVSEVEDPTLHASRGSGRSKKSSRGSSGPLQELSPNTPTLARTSTTTAKAKRKRDDSRGAGAIHLLSEAGPEDDGSSHKKARTSDTKPRSGGRLIDLLEHGSSPTHQVLTPKTVMKRRPFDHPNAPPTASRTTNRVTGPAIARSFDSSSARPSNPQPTTRTRPHSTSPSRSQSQSLNPTSAHPARPTSAHDAPLRSRPLSALTLSDFKINPAYSGTDFAFADPIRGRAARRCLPGCTRDCCRSLRAFVAAGADPRLAPRRRLFSSSPPPQANDPNDPDDPNNATTSTTTTTAQTLTPSQTARQRERNAYQAFADLHGRHRTAFARAASPPGFWRADFPSTQEQEADREEAERRVREEVEVRWGDAVRGDGRWMFRDEV